MSVKLTVITNPKKNINRDIKIKSPSDVLEIKEVKSIRNAMREHLFFIGLDTKNNVKNISLLGIGTTCNVTIDSKEIIRTALLTASEKVILVHNHPSNVAEPSNADIHISNVTNRMMEFYGIHLIDHVIVTKSDYISMESQKQINHKYIDNSIDIVEKGFLIEENKKLEKQVEELENKIKSFEKKNKEKVQNKIIDEKREEKDKEEITKTDNTVELDEIAIEF